MVPNESLKTLEESVSKKKKKNPLIHRGNTDTVNTPKISDTT